MKTIIAITFLIALAIPAERTASQSAPFIQAMNAGMTAMHRDMAAAEMNGNVDRDFASMMIPHHLGAVAMAKAELSYGSNPVMRSRGLRFDISLPDVAACDT